MPMERAERLFIIAGVCLIVIFFAAVTVSAFAGGMQLPNPAGRVDSTMLDQTPPFDKPGVRQLAAGKYEVVMTAAQFAFAPSEIRVPAGSTVTFKIASKDVIHGMMIPGKAANIMILPGQISVVTASFREPGEYLYICHEYCGTGHQLMFGKIIVE